MMAFEQAELSFENAEAVKQRGYDYIDNHSGTVYVDVGRLTRANSVSVAVLSAWHRRALIHQKSIVFVNLSQELRNIISFSGLDEVLDLG